MPVPLSTGIVLRDRYRIKQIIGQGGAGSIYLADDLRLEGRQCAIKEVQHDQTLPPALAQEAKEQFMREATVLARLDQANLPKVSDYFTDDNRDYLVMDYVPGKDLRTLILEAKQEQRFIEEADILNWANQLADALSYLHNQDPPILHRDIKPSNLKLTPSGLLKLVDFGLVKILAPGEVTITILQGQGTALYTPLEQYGGDSTHTDIRSDIYAFGATLYHLITNTPPAIARERFLHPNSLIPPSQINPYISVRTEKAILWAMSLHPNERPNNVEEFRQVLIGNKAPSRTRPIRDHTKINLRELIGGQVEKTLWIICGSLVLLSFIATLIR